MKLSLLFAVLAASAYGSAIPVEERATPQCLAVCTKAYTACYNACSTQTILNGIVCAASCKNQECKKSACKNCKPFAKENCVAA